MNLIIAFLVIVQAAPAPLTASAQPGAPPYVGHWLVESLDGIEVLPESRVTLNIESGTARGQLSISGMAPCNTYRGTLRVDDSDVMRIGQVLKTLKGCDPARMSEEADFFALLNDVVGYEVRGEALILQTHAGKTINARRVTN